MPQLDTPKASEIIDPVLRTIRGILLLIVVAGLVGMWVELVLMEHYEDFWMSIPVILIQFSLLAVIVHAFARARWSVRAIQVNMLLMILGGAIGTFLHHDAKEEFQLEGQPDLKGWELFWQASRAKSPPSLAPAALIQTGLLGLAWAYRHPAVMRKRVTSSTNPTGDPI